MSSKCSNSRARLSFVSMEGVSGGVGRPRETVEEEADLFLENVVVGGSFQWWRIVPDWWETAMASEEEDEKVDGEERRKVGGLKRVWLFCC